ncbi:hypothetical protein D9M72_324240 [compost metagenome]
MDTDRLQVGQAHSHGPVAAVLQQAHVHLQAGHRRLFHRGGGACRQRGETLVGLYQLASEEFALGAVQLQGKTQLVAAFPAIAVEQFRPDTQIGQRRTVGVGGLGALPGQQVVLGQLFTLGAGLDQSGAAIELADDLEDSLFAPLRRRLLGQQATDAQVRLVAGGFGDQRVCRFVDTVMGERVRALQALHQFLAHCRPENRVDLRRRQVEHGRQGIDLRHVAQAGQLLQGLAGFQRQARELSDHEVDDVVGIALGVDALRLPTPAAGCVVVGQQLFLGQRLEELNDEERVAGGLVLH